MSLTCNVCGKAVKPAGGTRYVLDWSHVKEPSPWHQAEPKQMGDPSKLLKKDMLWWIDVLQSQISTMHRGDADRHHRERVWDDYH